MKLNESRGNMYSFITHTGNAIKGRCYHDCSYCYMKKWGKQKKIRLEKSELKGDIGTGKFIFIGSSCDMFAPDIKEEWILDTLEYLRQFDNRYMFQSKSPKQIVNFTQNLPPKSVVCTTIETNIWFPKIMGKSPTPQERAEGMDMLHGIEKYVTIEPVMVFDLEPLVELIEKCDPVQVNIGADSGGNHLPEPKKDDVLQLISELEKFTKVKQKSNLKRLL